MVQGLFCRVRGGIAFREWGDGKGRGEGSSWDSGWDDVGVGSLGVVVVVGLEVGELLLSHGLL